MVQPFDALFVHKIAAQSNFLTGIDVDSGGACVAHFRIHSSGLPRHAVAQREEILVGFELIRQIGLAASHMLGDLPLGYSMIMRSMDFRWHNGASSVLSPGAGNAGRVVVHSTNQQFRKRLLSRHSLTFEVFVDEMHVATGHGDLDCLAPETVKILRRSATPWTAADLRHDSEGLLRVTTNFSGLTATLGWDADDPFIFDHGVDHIPGMRLVESALACGRLLAPHLEPQFVSVQCDRFAELSEPVLITALNGLGTASVAFRQNNEHVAAVQLLLPLGSADQSSSRLSVQDLAR